MSRAGIPILLLALAVPAAPALAESPWEPVGSAPVFALEGLDSDAPVSIRSEELEATETEGARTLVFEGGVEVEKGELRIRAGRLEATYPSGAREPSRLVGGGGVEVRHRDREARCQRVEYRSATERLVCRGDAQLRSGADELRGEAIVFDLRARRLVVEGATRVAMQPRARETADSDLAFDALAGGGPIVIQADSLEAVDTDAGRRLVFAGSVEVAQEDLKLTARRIEALIPPDAQEPSRLTAEGDVRIEQGGREARCDEAVYDRLRRRVDCRGAARLRSGEDSVSGDEMAFDLAEERLVVTGRTRVVLAPRAPESARP